MEQLNKLKILEDEEISNEYVLAKIIRYNHRCRLQDESVAAHSFFVSLFCLKIMAKLNLDVQTERQVLILAALHDTAESKTSDIPHDVKEHYPEMEDILAKIEKDYYEKHWKRFFQDVYKPSDLVYNILKLADSYSVYQYCLNEIDLGNVSNEIIRIKFDAMSRIQMWTEKINNCMKQKNER